MAKFYIAVIFALIISCVSAARPFHKMLETYNLLEDRSPDFMRSRHPFGDGDLKAQNDALEDEAEDDFRHPMEAMLKRGIMPAFSENDMEVFVNTKRLLDAVLQDGGSVQGGVAIYRFGSGKKQECVDGKKSLPAKCQWTGMVQWTGEDVVKETKLTVANKYCKQAGLTRPKNKKIDC